jgi:HEAT repeat protein
LLPLFSAGCANFWDEITDRDFQFQSLWTKPNPYLVLKDSTDGTKRAKALRALREPSQNGGTQEDQEVVMKLLTTAAVSEHTAVARMAAVESLGRCKDPRATQALIAAYYAADGYRTATGDRMKYSTDMASMLRCQSLRALGDQANPAAVEHLVTVLKQPPARGADVDKQMVIDERIAAARALAKFHDRRAEEALLDVMKSEKDIALRDRAHESLQTATGKKLPDDPAAWEDYLHHGQPTDALAGRDQPERVKLLNYRQNQQTGTLAVQPAYAPNGTPSRQ